MRFLIVIIGLWTSIPLSGFTQGFLLRAGDSYTYQFSTLPFQDFITSGAQEAIFSITLFPPGLGPGGVLSIQMFEDTAAAVPILSRTLTSTSLPMDSICVVPNAWTDLNGSIRLTMLSGNVRISWFTLQASVAFPRGFLYYEDVIVPVPEPSALALVAFAAGMVGWYAQAKKSRAVWTPRW